MAKHASRCPRCGKGVHPDVAGREPAACPRCGQSLCPDPQGEPSRKPPLIGEKLGEFEIIELVGCGGMGAVYKARQESLGRFVAVKVLPQALARDAKYLARFDREARAVAAVKHPNIIDIYTVGEDRGYRYIAMELVEGENLAEVLHREGRLPPDRALRVMEQLAAALAEAHAAGIIHRDIKPSNILLTPRGGVKVADFGIAKRPDVDTDVTQVGRGVGTPQYLAPEGARGQPLDARSDLYSLGACVYHLLAGQPPFGKGTTAEVVANVLESDPPALESLAPDAPVVLCRVIHRLLDKEPAWRYQSAGELLETLRAVEMSVAAGLQATRVLPPGVQDFLDKRRTARRSQQRRMAWIAGAAAVAALAMGLFLVPVLRTVRHPSPPEGTPAVERPQAGAPRQEHPTPHQPPVTEPQPKPPLEQPQPPPKPEPAAWETAWKEADTQAQGLLRDQRFGDALKAYEDIGKRFEDAKLAELVQAAALNVQSQADAACRQADTQARKLLADKKFDQATAALAPVIDRYGIATEKAKAQKLLSEIAAAKSAAAKQDEDEKRRQAEAARKAQDEKRRQLEERFTGAMTAVEMLATSWNFHGAGELLAKLQFEDKELSERLAVRRDGVARLAKLKAKLIEKANQAKPWLRKGTAVVPGTGGRQFKTTGQQVVKADDKGITINLITATSESTEDQTWQSLDQQTLRRLLELALSDDSAEDQLAAGILALGMKDAASAEKHFDKAESLGAQIDRYLGPLASAAFASAKEFLDKKDFAKADAALTDIEKKYAKTPWFASNNDAFASARAQAKAAIAEGEAEKLYAEAAKLFQKKELWELKPIVEKLKADYPNTKAVTDPTRKPTFAEMAKATETLGKFITVRQDGKGNFKTIQAAIDAAPPESTIEIQDNASYSEHLRIRVEGLTIRGRKGSLPLINYTGPKVSEWVPVAVMAPRVKLERLVVLPDYSAGQNVCISAFGNPVQLRWIIAVSVQIACKLEDSFAIGDVSPSDSAVARNSIVGSVGIRGDGAGMSIQIENVCCIRGIFLGMGSHVRFSTILGGVMAEGSDSKLIDCIAAEVRSVREDLWVENCNVFGKDPFWDKAKPGKRCFHADPLFRDPANFDYRLKPRSPCRGKASDGGDIGCRYTPEMIEILTKALELRKKGIIKF